MQVEIEVNGSPVDMAINIDETGKVFFYTRAPEVRQPSLDLEPPLNPYVSI